MANNCGEQLENRDLAWFLIKTGLADATPRELRVFIEYLFHDQTFAEIANKERVTITRVIANFQKSLRRITAAAQNTGLPVSIERRLLTVRQRMG
jgi:hypothetical protein